MILKAKLLYFYLDLRYLGNPTRVLLLLGTSHLPNIKLGFPEPGTVGYVPIDVWPAAFLSPHSFAPLEALHCDSRVVQQAYIPFYPEVQTGPLTSVLPHRGSMV